MVLIIFDESDKEIKNSIDDYFWYKYYVKIIEDDIKMIKISSYKNVK